MLSRIYFLITILTTTAILAQSPGSSSNSSARKEPQSSSQGSSELAIPPANGNYANGVNQNLATLEKSITEKITRLDKLQTQVASLNKDLKEKITLPDEVPNTVKDNGNLIVSARHIEFTFKEEKTKEVKIVSSKKRLSNDLHSVVRTLTFTPGDFASIKIKVDQFDSKMKGVPFVENYNNMNPDVKLMALKAIDLVLFNTIYRFDSYIQKGDTSKQENTKSHLTEL
jgi:septal ring factor EnvC (AmiA/AmiB activator)